MASNEAARLAAAHVASRSHSAPEAIAATASMSHLWRLTSPSRTARTAIGTRVIQTTACARKPARAIQWLWLASAAGTAVTPPTSTSIAAVRPTSLCRLNP